MGLPRTLYFIDRGEQPEHYRAPFHQHIICTDRQVAYWQAGSTRDGAWMWVREAAGASGNRPGGCGWLLVRWRGLDIDHGNVVSAPTLPDGTVAGFVHPHRTDMKPWSVLPSAVWWSEKSIPGWLQAIGVRWPKDQFSRDQILNPYRQRDGFRKTRYVFPSQEGAALADWLEDHNHESAAQDLRNFLLSRG